MVQRAEERQILERALLAVTDGVHIADPSGRVILDTLPFEVRRDLSEDTLDHGAMTMARPNGTHLRVSRQVLSDGSIITLTRDVTEETRTRQALEQATHTDPTTGCITGAVARLYGAEAVAIARRYGKNLSIIRIEMDETAGVESVEDATIVVKHVAQICRHGLREADMLAQLGQRSFLAILPETNAEGAALAAERLQKRVASSGLLHKGRSFDPAVTCTVAGYDDDTPDFDSLLQRAEDALHP